MILEQLKEKYKNVPEELKIMKRWVCFKAETLDNGDITKRPYNALNGKLAKVNDDLTWSTFSVALKGMIKYNCDGIGFILGNGIFGVDLDNHAKEGELSMSKEEFQELANEFVNKLDSYSEWSFSGNGIHIICQGALPRGNRRKGSVEMYDNGRFFVFTGNAIRNIPIKNREEEVKELWEKYLNVRNEEWKPTNNANKYSASFAYELDLTEEEIIQTALQSSQGGNFYRYYYDGDLSQNNNNHSEADLAFCNMLAFWCNCDKQKMDRIFRNSGLMRDKWDEFRGESTYGQLTLDKACSSVTNGYVKRQYQSNFSIKNKTKQEIEEVVGFDENGEIIEQPKHYKADMNIDENGEPIFKIKKIFKRYSYTDTGNAERFYDYFGDLFKYNTTDKIYMFYTGTTWIKDVKDIIRKYANKFIDILKEERDNLEEEIERYLQEGKDKEKRQTERIYDACVKNISRVSNKAGKDAMLHELRSLYDIPIESKDFDKEEYDLLLNTSSGIVDLRTGEIMPFDKEKLLSNNTNIEVSYEKPVVWLDFLRKIFDNGNEKETQRMIDSLQTCIGYSLSGHCKEQVMFLLYGGGSNGKSTLMGQISRIMGSYGDSISSSILMKKKVGNNSDTFSLAKLQKARYVETEETDDGEKLAEAQVKTVTGGSKISAQFKFGNEFSYVPKYKIWFATNNRPYISGKDFAIWRRLFLFPFKNTFTGKDKDKHLPDKLKAESSKILGWAIQGYMKYHELGDLIVPEVMEKEKQEYKEAMDQVAQFIKKECIIEENYKQDCKLLYARYKEWAQNNNEFKMRESRFYDDLISKGYKVDEKSGGRESYIGIRLK